MWLLSSVAPSPEPTHGPLEESIGPDEVIESTQPVPSASQTADADDFTQMAEDTGAAPRTNSEALDELFGLAPDEPNRLEHLDVSDAAVLMVGPAGVPTEHEACARHIAAPKEGVSHLLLVSFVDSPEERLRALQGFMDDLPKQVTVLNVGDPSRVGEAESETVIEGSTVTVKTMTNPTDVMRLGMTISKTLSDWEDRDGGIAICFHSLSALLALAVEPETVVRFLHVLRGRIKAVDATAHFHVDPTRHDEGLINTVQTVFDETLIYDQTGRIQSP